MEKTRKLLAAVSGKLQLPGEVLAAVPKLELTGKQMVSLEPHRGLLEYGREQISVSTGLGVMQIFGKNLRIILMNSHRITIEGTVAGIAWMEEAGE